MYVRLFTTLTESSAMVGRATLSIWIRNTPVSDGSYEVIAKVEPGDRTVLGGYRPDDVPEPLIADAISAVEDGTYTADETKALGSAMFEALFKADIRHLYEEASDPRLRLVVDLPAARHLPWELLHDGHRFLSLYLPFSRGITTTDAAAPLETELPLRILVVDAFPAGLDQLDEQVEVASIDRALRQLVRAGKASVTTVSGITVSGLKDALREAGAGPEPRPFHVLHFIGHGGYQDGRSVLLFEEDVEPVPGRRRPPAPVDPEGLVNLIGHRAAPHLRLVFLNSCRSAQTTAFATTESFGPRLLEAGIPAVIGMQNSVFDDMAALFASQFYEAIADGSPVDSALADSRAVAATSRPERVAEMGVPTLYMRSQTGFLFKLTPGPQPLWRKTLRYLADHVAAALIGLAVIAMLGWTYNTFIRPDPVMDRTTFNVAIAEFDTGSGVESDAAASLSANLFEGIEDALLELGFTSVWGPEQTGVVRGATAEDREDAAQKRADTINADVIVYGRLESSDFGLELIPEFYVNDRRSELGRAGAAELTGGYILGDAEAIDPDDLASANQRFADAMEGRAAALARFVMGLSLYAGANPNYEDALSHFRAAEQIDAWRREEGREILYVFIGNAELQLATTHPPGSPESTAAIELARAAYRQSLEIEDEYSRARLGLGEVLYHLAGGGACFDGIDDAGMAEAEASFRRGRSASVAPAHADVEQKADFGLARVSMCRRLAGSPDEGDPEALFAAVIAAYHAGNERLDGLAAESHGYLGLLAGTARDYVGAVEEYRAAADLLTTIRGPSAADRSAIMLRNAAFYQSRTPECAEAEDLYQEALDRVVDQQLRAAITADLASLSCP